MAYDNVIIFGAGASVDAGIPLLNNFVDTMWSLAIQKNSLNGPLSPDDAALFQRAIGVRNDLERYNSRANFRLRNLEDILSLLSFEAFSGTQAKENYNTFVNAITRTIELTTLHPKPDETRPLEDALNYSESLYHLFWNKLLETKSIAPPALISFNYDLVFERTLWDYFHFLVRDDAFKPAEHSCKINYFLKPYDFVVKAEKCVYTVNRLETPAEAGYVSNRTISIRCDGFKPSIQYHQNAVVEIPYLKLHGSLNWCSRTTPKQDEPISPELIPGIGPMSAVETPLILPPVFNKMNTGDIIPVWAKALEILRRAKHIIFIGYSLPRTDIYMQYFLKSAVGPNSSLQKIIVFDPALFGGARDEMRNRFRECFSPQFQEQITFTPQPVKNISPDAYGTFAHFVQSLQLCPSTLLFQ